jgi:hypothetical protein
MEIRSQESEGKRASVAEKLDELKRSFKHPTPFSSPDSAIPKSSKTGS